MRRDSIIVVVAFLTVIASTVPVSAQQHAVPGKVNAALDSIADISNRKDTIATPVRDMVDSLSVRFTDRLDSLNSLQLPNQKYTKGLDSLYEQLKADLSQLRRISPTLHAERILNRADSVVSAKQNYLDSLISASNSDFLVQQRDRLNLPRNLGSKELPSIPGFDLPSVPEINIPAVSSPKIDKTLPGLPQTNIPDIPSDIGDVQLPEIPKQVAELQKANVQSELEKRASDQLLKVDGVSSVADQSKAADALKEQVEGAKKLATPDQLQEKAKEQFVNYFEGKEEILKKDMDDIAKTQLKYRNITDSRFLPKRPPNEMKGKPFVERLIPGISFQVLQSNDILMDVAPFIGYRFSGKITATVSGYRRVVYVKRDDRLDALDCYGFRFYNNVKIYGSIHTHIEIERFKDSDDYSSIRMRRSIDPSWCTKVNLGIYQRYSLGKRMSGHFVIMYDLNQLKQFPNSSGTSARFGFDYQLKKKQRKDTK